MHTTIANRKFAVSWREGSRDQNETAIKEKRSACMTKLIGLTGAYDFLERMILGPAEARYNPKSRLMRP